uniref:Uncharacterized protein n=1 Tax=Anguilla anguilla TaxID=7936 RepID=A0A0E9T1V7_ANGAN
MSLMGFQSNASVVALFTSLGFQMTPRVILGTGDKRRPCSLALSTVLK